ncbi:hypothetical protein Tco_0498200, partial [Tanacetum coccineum]
DIAVGKIGSNNCSKLNKVLQAVFQCALWSVWKWRNKVVNAEQEAVDGVRNEDIFPLHSADYKRLDLGPPHFHHP